MNVEKLIESGIDHLTIVISKEEIQTQNIENVLNTLYQLISNETNLNYFRERVEILFDGYNNTGAELWEIPIIRDYVRKLDMEFPFWLYFLSKNGSGLYVIIRCFLLPYLKDEVEQEVNAKRLEQYLEARGFPAMNEACSMAKISMEENIEMTNRFITYMTSGKNRTNINY